MLLFGALAWQAFREEVSSQAYLANVATEVNKTLPRSLDGDTQLIETVGLQRLLVYRYRLLNYSVDELDADRFRDLMKPGLIKDGCREGKLFVRSGVTLRHVYMDKYDRNVVTIDVTPKDCGL